MLVGDIRIDPVLDGTAWFPAREAYPQAVPGRVDQHFGPGGLVRFPIGAFLIATSGRVVLVDCGAGPLRRDDFEAGALLDGLAARGVRPDDVTDVLFTHLHWDHVGWATRAGAVVFERATYRCHRADWDHFMCDERAARKLRPIDNRLEPWDAAGPLLPGIDALPAPGHTPGHSMIVVSSGVDRAIVLGDAAHCPLEIEDLEMGGIADVDPGLAAKTRAWVADELERTGTTATGPHFPDLAFGRLVRGEGARRWVIAPARGHHV